MLRGARTVVDAGARYPDALDQLLRATHEFADRCAAANDQSQEIHSLDQRRFASLNQLAACH